MPSAPISGIDSHTTTRSVPIDTMAYRDDVEGSGEVNRNDENGLPSEAFAAVDEFVAEGGG